MTDFFVFLLDSRDLETWRLAIKRNVFFSPYTYHSFKLCLCIRYFNILPSSFLLSNTKLPKTLCFNFVTAHPVILRVVSGISNWQTEKNHFFWFGKNALTGWRPKKQRCGSIGNCQRDNESAIHNWHLDMAASGTKYLIYKGVRILIWYEIWLKWSLNGKSFQMVTKVFPIFF